MNTELTTGAFSGLGQMFNELIKMTPQQISASGAPDFLKIAAMERQAQARQQPAMAPTSTVAAQVVNQAVGAPPAQQPAPQMPQGVPGMDTPPQGAQAGGYIHDYGVASLPYTPNYEHGGIVSFDVGGSTGNMDWDPNNSPYFPSEILQDGLGFVGDNPASVAMGLAALTPRRATKKLWDVSKKAAGKLGLGSGKNIAKTVWNNKGRLALGAGAIYGMLPDEEAVVEQEPQGDVEEMLAETPTTSQKPAGMGIPSISAPNLEFKPIDVSKLNIEKADVAPYTSPIAKLKELGIDSKKHFDERQAAIDKRLEDAKKQYKSKFLGEGLMNFGAQIAAGKNANFLQNVAGAVPAFTETAAKAGDKYEDYKNTVEDAKAALSDAQFASEKGDANTEIAAKQTYDDKVSAAANKLIDIRNAIRVDNAGLENKTIEKKMDQQLEILKANLSARTAFGVAQLEADVSHAQKAYELSVKGAMGEKDLAEFSADLDNSDPTLKELKASYIESKDPVTLALFNRTKQQVLIKALYDAGAYGTLRQKFGLDPAQLDKQFQGQQATVTQTGKKAGGILSLTH